MSHLKLTQRARLSLILLIGFFGVSCAVIKPYEKEYLLNPLMDDQSVARLEGPYISKTRPLERLAAAGASTGATACPTCGGK
ncbi:MAG: hypothetical protein NTV34_12740 [Proteobacteria bacterium]|nr:hypothetical protein [Pseudomonadota bacterium]